MISLDFSSQMAGPSWTLLPNVLIVEILSYLSLQDRLRTSLVCKRWRSCLFQPSLWPRIVLNLRRNRRGKTRFLVEVCGRFVRECVLKFNSLEPEEVIDCYRILTVLSDNKNLQVLQLEPSSCYIEWPENLFCTRFIKCLEDIIRTSRRLKHFSVGCSEEVFAHSSDLVQLLAQHHLTSLESIHLASVKEDPDNYGIIDLDMLQFSQYRNLAHLGLDYDYLDNQCLIALANNSRNKLKTLTVHVHGIDPEHEKIKNTTWRQLVRHSPSLEVTINLLHSYVGVSKLLDILQAELPLAHFRQFFCSNLNLAAIGLMSVHYTRTLRSIQIVDGFEGGFPVAYFADTDEDPLVMLAWKCPNLESISIIGYEICDNDLVAIARLRGKNLKELKIPRSCIRWIPENDDVEILGEPGPEFSNMISTSLGRQWRPVEDIELPDAVFDDWADAELAYKDILLQDQKYCHI